MAASSLASSFVIVLVSVLAAVNFTSVWAIFQFAGKETYTAKALAVLPVISVGKNTH